MKNVRRIVVIVSVLLLICSTALAYIGNRNTRKFHYDDCYSVNQMAERNMVYFESRWEAIDAGYVPCMRCRP